VSALGRYLRKHEKPYTLGRRNGKGVVGVMFYDGYVTIRSVQPGTSKFTQEIHITRSAWFTLVRSQQLKDATSAMEGPDFDRYRAERQYAKQEIGHLEALRQEKRDRKQGDQRQRYLRAKARARRRRDANS
jgi:hypothetical protein